MSTLKLECKRVGTGVERVTSAIQNRRRDQRAKKPAETATNSIVTLHEGTNSAVPELSSLDLFKGAKELLIRHNGADYRLRITAANKLILTK